MSDDVKSVMAPLWGVIWMLLGLAYLFGFIEGAATHRLIFTAVLLVGGMNLLYR